MRNTWLPSVLMVSLSWGCPAQPAATEATSPPPSASFRLYTVVHEARRLLLSASPRLDHDAWHTMRVVMPGDHIECSLDGERQLDAHDTTFTDAGMVGLWTKADAQTHFDDLGVSSAPAEAE